MHGGVLHRVRVLRREGFLRRPDEVGQRQVFRNGGGHVFGGIAHDGVLAQGRAGQRRRREVQVNRRIRRCFGFRHFGLDRRSGHRGGNLELLPGAAKGARITRDFVHIVQQREAGADRFAGNGLVGQHDRVVVQLQRLVFGKVERVLADVVSGQRATGQRGQFEHFAGAGLFLDGKGAAAARGIAVKADLSQFLAGRDGLATGDTAGGDRAREAGRSLGTVGLGRLAGNQQADQAAADSAGKGNQGAGGEAQRRGHLRHKGGDPGGADQLFDHRHGHHQAADAQQGGKPQGHDEGKRRVRADRRLCHLAGSGHFARETCH